MTCTPPNYFMRPSVSRMTVADRVSAVMGAPPGRAGFWVWSVMVPSASVLHRDELAVLRDRDVERRRRGMLSRHELQVERVLRALDPHTALEHGAADVRHRVQRR